MKRKNLLILMSILIFGSCSKDMKDVQGKNVLQYKQKQNLYNAITKSTIYFSGYTWEIKEPSTPVGPGPNYWSGDNVWVDENGWLHLRIRKNPVTNIWECAEVSATTNFGYGTFQWKIDGPLSTLDKNVVLGLFNYSGNDRYDEMDIEFARWGNDAWDILNYTVWPATGSLDTIPGVHTANFTMSGTYSTHRFKRTADSVVFKSMHGFQDDDTYMFENKTFTSPSTSISTLSMPILMNLWLYEGNAPSDGQSVEIVIHEFKYTPL
ncbi:glycoside hydrolase family 16 protein [Pseudopedobacter beijingensis]